MEVLSWKKVFPLNFLKEHNKIFEKQMSPLERTYSNYQTQSFIFSK